MPGLIFMLALLAASGYETSIQQWRAEREKSLKAEDGWLSLAGLFWLQEGENSVGSANGSRVQLPPGLPAHAGVLVRKGSRVHFGKRELHSDRSGKQDVVRIGRIRLMIIERGTKIGVRMKDPQSEARMHFHGLSWFPVREDWRIRARFVPQPRKMIFDAQAGDPQQYTSPGYVEWQHGGQTFRLTPVDEDGQLFFVFRDATAGKSTYAAARFLYADPPTNGYVIMDFNKAYNPPCVFTPYATCPLPPPGNRLRIPVDAGEKIYEHITVNQQETGSTIAHHLSRRSTMSTQEQTTAGMGTGTDNTLRTSSIYGTAKQIPEISLFVQAVEAAGMKASLEIDNLTLFAPTNEALRDMPRERLADIVSAHIVHGRQTEADLRTTRTVKSLSGEAIPVEYHPEGSTFGGAHIIRRDIACMNGTIQIIDRAVELAPAK